jgi:hypothetical protein
MDGVVIQPQPLDYPLDLGMVLSLGKRLLLSSVKGSSANLLLTPCVVMVFGNNNMATRRLVGQPS